MPTPEPLTPAMQLALESLDRHTHGATDFGGRDPWYRGEEAPVEYRSRESASIAAHQRTLAAIASYDVLKWSGE